MQAFSGFAVANADEAGPPATDSLLRLRRPRHLDRRSRGRVRCLLTRSWSAARFGSRRRCWKRSSDVLQAIGALPRRSSTACSTRGTETLRSRVAPPRRSTRWPRSLESRRSRSLARSKRRSPHAPLLRERASSATAGRRRHRPPGRGRAYPRADFRESGLLRDLPLPHAEPLAAGGRPGLGSRDYARTAPLPGVDTEHLRRDPESFWRPRAESA